MTALPPNSELVAVAWIGGITGLTADQVSTRLPADQSVWSASGFVTVGNGDTGGVIGGAPSWYMQLRAPVVSVHCWAVTPGSAKPPWGKAATLAERVVAGCYDEARMCRDLSFSGGYGPARVHEAYPLSEPRRILNDPGGYAHYQLDLQFHWVAVA